MKFKKLLFLSLLMITSSSFAMLSTSRGLVKKATPLARQATKIKLRNFTNQAKNIFKIQRASTVGPSTVKTFETASKRLNRYQIKNALQGKASLIKEALNKAPKDIVQFKTLSESAIQELEQIKKDDLIWYKNPLNTAVVTNELRNLRNQKKRLEELLKFIESPEGKQAKETLDKFKDSLKWTLLVKIAAYGLAIKEITDVFTDFSNEIKEKQAIKETARLNEEARKEAARLKEEARKEAARLEKEFLKTPFNYDEMPAEAYFDLNLRNEILLREFQRGKKRAFDGYT